LYQDASGGWHIIDYKTNHVAPDDVDQISKQYELQMYVYALVVERALGQPPVELALNFLRPGVEKQIPWDDAARSCAIQLLNDRIAAATNKPFDDELTSLTKH
jgi:hypothetical protein